ncbi:DNA/RNA helicase domain-containing protein [Streptomyces spiramyceticus]|uniref:DNA/RNA helicase domain-containing protein n=1 Tax=Streptomyces spiramyceticus TaxID=299717 RepID=UPI00237BBC47|nr:DNA/RNA helicase domain-containing protein [Streptomyces spiramyceticus]
MLAKVADTMEGHDGFRLIGDQDKARQTIHRAIEAIEQRRPGQIVVVTGGLGTGKTAIAARVLGDLCSNRVPTAAVPVRNAHPPARLRRWGRGQGPHQHPDHPLSRGLNKDTSIVLLDEAHRARTVPLRRNNEFPDLFTRLTRDCAALVLFLDERQIVRPSEGTTLDELRRLARACDDAFAHVDLTTQFRCLLRRREAGDDRMPHSRYRLRRRVQRPVTDPHRTTGPKVSMQLDAGLARAITVPDAGVSHGQQGGSWAYSAR